MNFVQPARCNKSVTVLNRKSTTRGLISDQGLGLTRQTTYAKTGVHVDRPVSLPSPSPTASNLNQFGYSLAVQANVHVQVRV